MRYRFQIILLLFLVCSPGYGGILDWFRSGPCPAALVQELYSSGQDQNFDSLRTFRRWVNRLPSYHGLTIDLVKRRYHRLNERPELVRLMKGMDVPSGEKNERPLRLSGGWGQDFLFVPSFPLWEAVHENFAPLVDRMGRHLHLHPILMQQMFRGDHTGIGDSGWVIVEWNDGNEIKRATVKITFYDREMTPDGPFPRFSFESALADYFWTTYRTPRNLTGFQADLALEGFFSLKSSLDHWGLLPLEGLTHELIPEHQAATYDPQFAGLFGDPFLLRHRIYMANVIDNFKTSDIQALLAHLHEFRERFIPQGALEVAELGRFNIPEGAPASVRAQLYYGLSLLLSSRKINTLYLLSPKPRDPSGHRIGPDFEVFSVAPGWNWLAEIAEEVAAEQWRASGRNQPTPGPPPADPLRRIYRGLGFDLVSSPDYVFGLPSGANIMRSPIERVLCRIGAYQLARPTHLLAEQTGHIQTIQEGLENSGCE